MLDCTCFNDPPVLDDVHTLHGCIVCKYAKVPTLLPFLSQSVHVNLDHCSLLSSGFCVSSADAILRAVLIVRWLFDLPHLKRSLVNLMDRRVSFQKHCWLQKNYRW